LLGQYAQGRAIALHKIRELFNQIMSKRWPWLDAREDLSFPIAYGIGEKRDCAGFPFCYSFCPGDGVQVLKGLFLKCLQFVNLTPNHGKALRNIK
jgi:hypothetical protein